MLSNALAIIEIIEVFCERCCTVLASLDTKKQALVLGHAIAMPVVVQTREYDEVFYRAMQPEVTAHDIQTFMQELF